MIKFLKTMSILVLVVLVLFAAAVFLFMRRPMFGSAPTGVYLERIQSSPNYRDNQFQNIHHTPDLTEGASYYRIITKFLFGKSKRSIPADLLPSKKTDLFQLDPKKNILVWFGHSSYFMQLDGKKFLVDPVLKGSASPVKFTTRSYRGTDVYTTSEIPEIDYLIITHDHWDHLDYETVTELKPKVRQVITGLGVGAHLRHWGYEHNTIAEMDWMEQWSADDGFSFHAVPARHFSGRGFKRNGSLWMSFALTTPTMKIFIGGDSGYDTHFAEIGATHGPFDLVILENGQYNEDWKYIHMQPEEVVQAATDLQAKKLFPVHWSKFSLALHDWDEPIVRVFKEAEIRNMPLLHPQIGDAAFLQDTVPSLAWWHGLH